MPRPRGSRSTCPDAMAWLFTAFSGVHLNGEVRYGPAPGDASAMEVISIGFIGPADDAAADSAITQEGLNSDNRESYQVHCAVAVLTGDEGPQPAVARAFDLLAQCTALVDKNPRMDELVLSAFVASWALREDTTTGGAHEQIRFDVAVDAFTR